MKKAKIKNVLGIGLLTSVLCCSMIGITKAENWWDDFGFSLNFSTGNPYGYSQPLNKDSYSSCGVYNSCGYAFYASIAGFDGGIREDITMKNTRIAPYENNASVVNWVKESGLNQAVLRGESIDDEDYYVRGRWSADL